MRQSSLEASPETQIAFSSKMPRKGLRILQLLQQGEMGKYWNWIMLVHLLFVSINVWGQATPDINRLKGALTHAELDSTTVQLYNDLAWEYRTVDIDSTIVFARKGLALAVKLGYLAGQAEAWNRIGNGQEASGNFEKAKASYLTALQIDKQIGNAYGVGRDYHQVGVVYAKKGEFQTSIEWELKSIKQLTMPPRNQRKMLALASIYNSTGNAYKHLGQYKEAIQYFRKGLSIREQLSDSIGISKSLNEIALVYEYLKMYQTAVDLHNQSLDISDKISYLPGKATSCQNIGNIYSSLLEFDKALSFYQESLMLKARLTDKVDYQDLVHNIGVLYLRKGNFDKAIEYFNQSLEARQKLGNRIKIAESYYQIALAFYHQNSTEEALAQLKIADSTLKNHENPLLKAMILEQTANAYAAIGDSSKSLQYFLMYSKIADSLSDQELLALEYDRKLLESQNKLRIAAKELTLEKLGNRNNLLLMYMLIGGGVLCITIFVFFMLNVRDRQRLIIAKQEIEISQKEIDYLLNTQELELITATLNGQEEERHKIASDLHDRLGGILSMVKLHFKAVQKNILNIDSRIQEQYTIANTLLNDATDTIREITNDIGNSLLLNLGLLTAVEDLAYKIESSQQLSVMVVTNGIDSRLPAKIEMNLFKIIQELLSNILKHADAGGITLNFLKADETLFITVEDDGKGFDIATSVSKNGFGILSIRSRIEKINGKIDFDSQLGHGTTVSLEIPIKSI